MTNDKNPDGGVPPGANGDAAHVPAPPPRKGAAWGEPIMALDKFWTRFEIGLAVVVFVLETFSMVLWVCLKGFSAPADHISSVVFRAIVGATVLGIAAHVGFAKKDPKVRRNATLAAVFIGMLATKMWLRIGSDYASNMLNWYQQASFLALLGGLRGVGTRLTMLLALVGGSLATARGRHIVIDIVTWFVKGRARTFMVIFGSLASALVCVVAAWGFFDHIAIESFEAGTDDPPAKKVGHVVKQLGEDFFIARKQIALDFKSTSHVLLHGEVYSDWLTGKEWNEWIDTSGFPERYGKEGADGVKIPEDETRAPLIVVPGRGEPRGELINAGYLVFPIGLLIIAARFFVRVLLTLSGHFGPEAEESDEWNEHGTPQQEEI